MKYLLILAMTLLISGCGGGTTGSASSGIIVEKRLFGILNDLNGMPLINAKVEVASTGDTTTTNSKGEFTIVSKVPTGPNEILITDTEGKKYIIKTLVKEEPGDIELTLVFSQIGVSKYKEWQLTASVSGIGCDDVYYSYLSDSPQELFDNEANVFGSTVLSLSQYRDIKVGTKCDLIIEVLKEGKPVSNLSYRASNLLCGNFELVPSDINSIPLSEGVSDVNGKILVPFTAGGSDICQHEVVIPKFGGLKLGALLQITTKAADF